MKNLYKILPLKFVMNINMNLQEQINRIHKMMGVDMSKSTLIESDSKMNPRIRRRIGDLDYEFEERLKTTIKSHTICDFKSDIDLFETISELAIDSMYYTYFADLDDNSGEWNKMYNQMVKYFQNKYSDKVKEFYHINCGD